MTAKYASLHQPVAAGRLWNCSIRQTCSFDIVTHCLQLLSCHKDSLPTLLNVAKSMQTRSVAPEPVEDIADTFSRLLEEFPGTRARDPPDSESTSPQNSSSSTDAWLLWRAAKTCEISEVISSAIDSRRQCTVKKAKPAELVHLSSSRARCAMVGKD